jgi:hypothetical protein
LASKIQEAKDRMNAAEAELRDYVESKEPRDRKKHKALAAKMQGTIREFEKRVAQLLKKTK